MPFGMPTRHAALLTGFVTLSVPWTGRTTQVALVKSTTGSGGSAPRKSWFALGKLSGQPY